MGAQPAFGSKELRRQEGMAPAEDSQEPPHRLAIAKRKLHLAAPYYLPQVGEGPKYDLHGRRPLAKTAKPGQMAAVRVAAPEQRIRPG